MLRFKLICLLPILLAVHGLACAQAAPATGAAPAAGTVPTAIAPAAPAAAGSANDIPLQDMQMCYGLAGIASMTVNFRNSGMSLDEQLARCKRSLGTNPAVFELAQDITKQVYERDIKDQGTAVAATHASCLQARGHTQKVASRAVQQCPMSGLLMAEVSALRKKGASADDIAKTLGDRYTDVMPAYKSGLAGLVSHYSDKSPPENGLGEYMMCMVLGRPVGP